MRIEKVISFFILIIVMLSSISCGESPKKEAQMVLSELQITACNSAHGAGTCDTRLNEVGIVLKEDCCKYLAKCC